MTNSTLMSPKLENEGKLNSVAQEWDTYWNEVKGPTLIGRLSHTCGELIVCKVLSSLELPKNAHLLDLGCGSGRTLEIFRELGFCSSIGIDNSKEALKKCSERGFTLDKDVFEVDGTRMPYSDSQFDIVFSWGLLEHFRDFSPFVKEMCRVSRTYILILQPNHYSLYGRLLITLSERLRDNVKEYSYHLRDFISAFQKYGFFVKILRMTPLREFAILLFEKHLG